MLADGPRLMESDIRGIVVPPTGAAAINNATTETTTYDEAFAVFERNLITQTLLSCDGKVTEAARRLGLGRATLYKKIAALGL